MKMESGQPNFKGTATRQPHKACLWTNGENGMTRMKDGYMIMSINACIWFLSRNRSKRRWVAGASLRVQVMIASYGGDWIEGGRGSLWCPWRGTGLTVNGEARGARAYGLGYATGATRARWVLWWGWERTKAVRLPGSAWIPPCWVPLTLISTQLSDFVVDVVHPITAWNLNALGWAPSFWL